jgi:hypothetical protein
MTVSYKVLGQINPSANTLSTLYTVPGIASAVTSTLCICNQSSSSATFRVAVRPAGEAIDPKHYIAYDTPIPSNDTIHLTIGASLANTDVISVYASSTTMSFTLFGSEIS